MGGGGAREGWRSRVWIALAILLAGCGHDWSAGDAADADGTSGDDGEVALDDGGPLDVPDDAPPVDGEDAGFDDAPPVEFEDAPIEDAPIEDAPIEVPMCPDANPVCAADGMSLEVCDPETGLWTSYPCSIACVAEERPRCAELVPSNLPTGESWMRGSTDVTCADGSVRFDTSSGSIVHEGPGGTATSIRGAGEGELDGIPFVAYGGSSTGSMPLGAWSLHYLAVGAGCTVIFTGDLPAALLLEADVVVDGRITAAAGPTTTTSGTPGPGGGAGGEAEEPGAGTGRGLPGGSGPMDSEGGGGGAGFGGPGGRGGNVTYGAGGPGGTSYGAAELVPLVGGSGGGGGSRTHGGVGGGGGGALQISTQGSIWINATGRVDAGGGGGQGGREAAGDSGSGGGGGSGGALLLEAARVEVHGLVAANGGGGGGGAGTESTDGQPGEPGGATTLSAAGGLAPRGGTSGGAGSDAATAGGEPGLDSTYREDENGGGGGGGAGRIRINGFAVDVAAAILSPAPGTGLATVGTPMYR